jgi:cell division protein FtsW (lipid II flippase)
MRRFLSFRDFDWTLLGMVLLLCTISVFEIYSATLHTRYTGFHTKQIFWIVGGLAAMYIFSKIDYHKLSPPNGSSWCSFWPSPATLPIWAAVRSPGRTSSRPLRW